MHRKRQTTVCACTKTVVCLLLYRAKARSEMERSGIELAWLGAKARSEMERSGIEVTGEGESPVYACGKSVVEIFGIFQKYRTIFEL